MKALIAPLFFALGAAYAILTGAADLGRRLTEHKDIENRNREFLLLANVGKKWLIQPRRRENGWVAQLAEQRTENPENCLGRKPLCFSQRGKSTHVGSRCATLCQFDPARVVNRLSTKAEAKHQQAKKNLAPSPPLVPPAPSPRENAAGGGPQF